MPEKAAHTTFIVAADRDALILEKLAGIEEALQGLVPLLEQIITQLETQTAKAPVPMATYADLYDIPEAGPPEGERVAAVMQPPPARPVRWWVRALRGTS